MDGIEGGVPVSGSSGWQGGEVFSEVERWSRVEAVSQMKTIKTTFYLLRFAAGFDILSANNS